MLISIKYQEIQHVQGHMSLYCFFPLLVNVKMPTTFMSRKNSMLSWVDHGIFITSGSGHQLGTQCYINTEPTPDDIESGWMLIQRCVWSGSTQGYIWVNKSNYVNLSPHITPDLRRVCNQVSWPPFSWTLFLLLNGFFQNKHNFCPTE